MSAKTKAMLTSFLRVLGATTLAAYLELGKAPLDLRLDDLTAIVNATIAALILTAVNYLRSGETRFGRGAEDMGMGGEDTVTPPDGQIITPEGPIEPPVEMIEPDPQPVEEPVEDQSLLRSTPLDEIRDAARRAPVKRTRKAPPTP